MSNRGTVFLSAKKRRPFLQKQKKISFLDLDVQIQVLFKNNAAQFLLYK